MPAIASALSLFKQALVPGARFLIHTEGLVIRGNLQTTVIRPVVEGRTVASVGPHRVVFLKPNGQQTTFDFPRSSEMSMEGGSFVYTDGYGKRVLSYTPDGVLSPQSRLPAACRN